MMFENNKPTFIDLKLSISGDLQDDVFTCRRVLYPNERIDEITCRIILENFIRTYQREKETCATRLSEMLKK